MNGCKFGGTAIHLSIVQAISHKEKTVGLIQFSGDKRVKLVITNQVDY
jgi:hypothetical protein